MIRHQTVDMAKHIDPVQRQSEEGQDRLSAEVIEEDRGLCVAAGRHKIDDSRKFFSVRSGHEGEIA